LFSSGAICAIEVRSDVLHITFNSSNIKLDDVSSYVANVGGQRVGVIKIKSFTQTTRDDVQVALSKAKGEGVAAITLDLRDNSGGLLQGAVDTASLFLPSGADVVYVIGKAPVADRQTTLQAEQVCDT
jgi:carboxyl-terminal processing protease